jgi:hypothetical protein
MMTVLFVLLMVSLLALTLFAEALFYREEQEF